MTRHLSRHITPYSLAQFPVASVGKTGHKLSFSLLDQTTYFSTNFGYENT
jgi:hypothetical protein